MSPTPDTTSVNNADVIDYYRRNWEKIANCYALDEAGLPTDPAWYRRRLYQQFLDRRRPGSILDIGCGGGWTVLDAAERGLDVRGIEPVPELVNHGRELLRAGGHDPDRITEGDLGALATLPDASLDCIALLSVLPHVPRSRWDDVHRDIARVLRPGGVVVAAYRNELFDLFTFNSFTVEFYDRSLWGTAATAPLRTGGPLEALKGLMTNANLPGPYFTAALDKSFGQLDRPKTNPLTLPAYLAPLGLQLDRMSFYHFHCAPPLMLDAIEQGRQINHELELSGSADWRGHFMAAMFLAEAVRA
jgi:SAM-dependent methyltransferase